MIALPLWAVYGSAAACLSALMFLLQERYRLPGPVLALWNKLLCVLVMIPLMISNGIPDQPLFYLLVLFSAMLWAIADVILFETIPKVGAGVVSRLLPATVIISFLLWFVVDPALIAVYVADPARSIGIILALIVAVLSAIALKRCPVSWEGARLIAFVFFAAVIGPIITKLVTRTADITIGPAAFVGIEGMFMTVMLCVYIAVRRRDLVPVLGQAQTIKAGVMIGICGACAVFLSVTALYSLDNPALLPAVKFLDSVLIVLFYAATGRREPANWLAGFGLVGSAVALVLLKG